MKRVTADSNVYISAILRGKPRDLLNLAKTGKVELALSEDILSETLRVLGAKFKRTPEELRPDEAHLRRITRMVRPIERLDAVAADSSDNSIPECTVAADSEVLVSGDHHLLDLGEFRGIKIVTVAAFLETMQGRMR